MANQAESPIKLQSDTLTEVPGGGVRTITASVMINGVLTPVQMQVVALADANGNIIDGQDLSHSPQFAALLSEMKLIREMMAKFFGVVAFDHSDDYKTTLNL